MQYKGYAARIEYSDEDKCFVGHIAGITPQRPYSGKVMLRIPPELHAEIAMKAQASGKSLNQWAAETLSFAE